MTSCVVLICLGLKIKSRHDRQSKYNVKLRRVCVTIVAVRSDKYYTFSVCVCTLSYATRKAHAPCGLSNSTIFFTLSHIRHNFLRKKKVIEYKISVFHLPSKFVWNISRSKKTSEILSYVCIGLLVKCPLFSSDFEWTWIVCTDFQKILIYQI
jgi:hypothetical protein